MYDICLICIQCQDFILLAVCFVFWVTFPFFMLKEISNIHFYGLRSNVVPMQIKEDIMDINLIFHNCDLVHFPRLGS